MATTSWLDYIQADATTRHQMDRASSRHRDEMAALHTQTQTLRDIAVIGVEQVKGIAQVAASVEGVRDEIVGVRQDILGLNALFDWKLEQVQGQLDAQTLMFKDIRDFLKNPIGTQALELWERGQYGAKINKFETALRDYQQAVDLNPYLYPAYLQIGLIQAYRNFDFAAAENALDEAASIAAYDHPQSAAVAHFHMHKLARERGETKRAWNHIVEACKSDPDLAAAWWDRATLARELALPREVLSSLNAAIERDALYWHRATSESWGLGQAEVDALLGGLAERARDEANHGLEAFASWSRTISEDISHLQVKDRQALSQPLERSNESFDGISKGLHSSEYAVQRAAASAANVLLTETANEISTRSSSLLETLHHTLRSLQSEIQELKNGMANEKESGAQETMKEGGFGLGCILLVLLSGFMILMFGAMMGDGERVAALITIGLVIAIWVVYFWQVGKSDERKVTARVSGIENRWTDLIGRKEQELNKVLHSISTLRRLSSSR